MRQQVGLLVSFHCIVPESGVRENVQSLLETYVFRDSNRPVRTGERCSVREVPGVTVLARYADDGLPALAVRRDADCTRVYVAASGGLSPSLFNRFAREAGGVRRGRPHGPSGQHERKLHLRPLPPPGSL